MPMPINLRITARKAPNLDFITFPHAHCHAHTRSCWPPAPCSPPRFVCAETTKRRSHRTAPVTPQNPSRCGNLDPTLDAPLATDLPAEKTPARCRTIDQCHHQPDQPPRAKGILTQAEAAEMINRPRPTRSPPPPGPTSPPCRRSHSGGRNAHHLHPGCRAQSDARPDQAGTDGPGPRGKWSAKATIPSGSINTALRRHPRPLRQHVLPGRQRQQRLRSRTSTASTPDRPTTPLGNPILAATQRRRGPPPLPPPRPRRRGNPAWRGLRRRTPRRHRQRQLAHLHQPARLSGGNFSKYAIWLDRASSATTPAPAMARNSSSCSAASTIRSSPR
jgi:hypothetical protein